jgi:hypothetical protein
MATRLVAAGVRISYAQLLAAANSMVAGLEVWVHAQEQLGIQTDIPAAAEAVCTGSIRQVYLGKESSNKGARMCNVWLLQ